MNLFLLFFSISLKPNCWKSPAKNWGFGKYILKKVAVVIIGESCLKKGGGREFKPSAQSVIERLKVGALEP